jgi:hypothetical protein
MRSWEKWRDEVLEKGRGLMGVGVLRLWAVVPHAEV